MIKIVLLAVPFILQIVGQPIPPRGACDKNTCKECLETEGCGWYTLRGVGGMSGCYDQTNAPNSITHKKVTECPECDELYTCKDCMEQRNCTWWQPKTANPMGPTCSKSNDWAKTSVLWSGTKSGEECPMCAASTCEACMELGEELDGNTTSATRVNRPAAVTPSKESVTGGNATEEGENEKNSTEAGETGNETAAVTPGGTATEEGGNEKNATGAGATGACVWSTLTGLGTNGRCTTPNEVPFTHSIESECVSGVSSNFAQNALWVTALAALGVAATI